MSDERQIIVKPTPFVSPKVMLSYKGRTIKQIVDQMYEESDVPAVWRDYSVMVEINGDPVPRDNWSVVPAVDDHVLVHVPVSGGGGGDKDTMRAVLSIVVVVVAAAATWYAGGVGGWGSAGALGLKGAAAAAYGAGVGMAVSTAGMFLINALAPVRPPSLDTAAANEGYANSPTYSLTGSRNQANPFGPVPVPLGKHRMYPPYGANPYTELLGSDEYLRMLFIWGYGPLYVTDMKIGDTPVGEYEGVTIEHRAGYVTDAPITLYPHAAYQQAVGVELIQGAAATIRAAEPYVDEISVDISFPQGLQVIQKDWGQRLSHGVTVVILYREIGTSAWSTVGAPLIIGNTTMAIRRGYAWAVDRTKKYEVALYKTTGNEVNPNIIGYIVAEYIFHETYWTVIRGRKSDHPVNFPYPLCMTALRIKASNQLQGVIDSFNGLVQSIVPVWTGAAWTDGAPQISENPAALYRSVLMHPANARRKTALQINNDNLGYWYDSCETQGYRFDMIRDYQTSVWETLSDIATSGRAAVSLVDGLWGVIIDGVNRPIINHITPRNSWGFSADKALFHHPHAFRVKFKNEEKNYEWDERIVYDDGYNNTNATRFESIEFLGITSPALVWKFARFHIAQSRLRPETFSVYQDLEHFVSPRGSKVLVAHDIPLWGSGWGRVKELLLNEDETRYLGVVLDDKVVMDNGISYAVRFRLADADNTSLCLSINTEAGETDTLHFQTFIPIATGVQAGDLAMVGPSTRETVACVVKKIERAYDFSAKLILVDEASAIYTADTGAIPDYDTHITRPLDITKIKPAMPSITGIQSGTAALEVFGGSVRSRIFVAMALVSINVKVNRYRVRYRLTGTEEWQFVETPVEQGTAVISGVNDNEVYEIQASVVSIYGVESDWCEVKTHVVVGQGEAPPQVENFSLNVISGNAHLSWDPVTGVPDFSHYRIRRTQNVQYATWTSSVDVVKRVTTTSVVVPAMIGTYLIKAVDFAGNESEEAALVTTSLSQIMGLNFVTALLEDHTFWESDSFVLWEADVEWADGVEWAEFNNVSPVTYRHELEGLILDIDDITGVMASEGYYELGSVIDLNGVFQVRVSAELEVEGVDLSQDLYEVSDLYSLNDLYPSVEGLFTVELQLKMTRDDPNDPAAVWTEWSSMIVGDYNARAFRGRVILRGTPPNITPLVYSVSIQFDMEDRSVGFNAVVPVGGCRITIDPPFFKAPEIGLAVMDMQEGDVYPISNKTETGFDIIIMNNSVSVERTITGIAKSYGIKEV